MSTNMAKSQPKITINSEDIEDVTYFDYIGFIITNNGDCTKVRRRLAMSFQRVVSM
uniref:Uncharacterized protein n=1 Tax=Arion vulgaris TaxID=1028688 RepID=A0A0B7B8X2_9EUPU